MKISNAMRFAVACALMAALPATIAAKVPNLTQGLTSITTREGLAAISDNLSGAYALGADIDLSGFDWKPIGNGSAAFRGRFYGQGHSIRNLVCTNNPSANSYRGLFGCTCHAIIEGVSVSGTVAGKVFFKSRLSFNFE